MKKLLVIVSAILAAVSLFACASGPKTLGKGKIMSIELPSNPTTGFDWDYKFEEGEATLYLDKEEYVPASNEDLVGAGGTKVYRFVGENEGKAKLIFTYKRPWEGGEVAYDVIYEIEVDADKNVTCVNKTKGVVDSDKDLSFFPDPKFANE